MNVSTAVSADVPLPVPLSQLPITVANDAASSIPASSYKKLTWADQLECDGGVQPSSLLPLDIPQLLYGVYIQLLLLKQKSLCAFRHTW